MSRIKRQIINIDGTGIISRDTVFVNAILGIASADSPSCIIEDTEGTIVYQINGGMTGERYFPLSFAQPMPITLINTTTFTNMERVIIFADRIQNI